MTDTAAEQDFSCLVREESGLREIGRLGKRRLLLFNTRNMLNQTAPLWIKTAQLIKIHERHKQGNVNTHYTKPTAGSIWKACCIVHWCCIKAYNTLSLLMSPTCWHLVGLTRLLLQMFTVLRYAQNPAGRGRCETAARGGTKRRVTFPTNQSFELILVRQPIGYVLGCPAAWLWELWEKEAGYSLRCL